MSHRGPERYQSNRNIRKLLSLAGASQDDVFYDLGCGIGQLCIIAATEFNVKRAVGIESHQGRVSKAIERVRKFGLTKKVEIIHGNIWDQNLDEATVLYYGLIETEEELPSFEERLAHDARLVTLAMPLVGVLPNRADYPFYLMELPFDKTRIASEWIQATLFKKSTLDELFDELDSDTQYGYDKRLLKRLMWSRLDLPNNKPQHAPPPHRTRPP